MINDNQVKGTEKGQKYKRDTSMDKKSKEGVSYECKKDCFRTHG